MGELKAHEFESAVAAITRQYKIFLIYGPDRGLVSERAAVLAGKSGVDLKDPFSVVRLDAEHLASDPARLVDESQSIGLFGGRKLIWLRASGTEKPVVDGMSRLLPLDLTATFIVFECGDLKKGAALRKLAEGSGSAVAIPCYPDDIRSINRLIDQELAKEGLAITATARQRLLDILGGDRIASRNEISKLVLYCRGEAIIDDHHIIDIVGDASAISTDDAVDAILSGDLDGFYHAMQKIITSKTAVFLVLQGCLRQMQLMDLMRSEMELKRQNASQVVATLGRHIHFKRKPILEQALTAWSTETMAREMNRLQSAILQSRQRAALEDSIALQTLLSTTLQSRRR